MKMAGSRAEAAIAASTSAPALQVLGVHNAVTDDTLLTSLWLDVVIGALLLLTFCLLQRSAPHLYRYRQVRQQLTESMEQRCEGLSGKLVWTSEGGDWPCMQFWAGPAGPAVLCAGHKQAPASGGVGKTSVLVSRAQLSSGDTTEPQQLVSQRHCRLRALAQPGRIQPVCTCCAEKWCTR